MLDSCEVKNRLRQFIAETAFVSEDSIKDETQIFDEGILDSMGFLSLRNYVEDEFQIKVDDAELLEENFESIDVITDFIEKKSN